MGSTSQDAYNSIDPEKLRAIVLAVVASFGDRGCISDEVRAALPDLAYSSVTARYAWLDEKGYIVRGPDRRKGDSGRGQWVMRAVR